MPPARDKREDRAARCTGLLTGVVVSAGLLSVVLGIIVLLGWHTHNTTLIQVFPAFVPMQYNTAVGFILCGTALLLAIGHRLRLAAMGGAIAAAIGTLTLSEYVFVVDLGIDELLQKHYIMVGTSHPGRMAPNTAICFGLIGLASLFLAVAKLRSSLAPVILGSLAFGLGIVALSGYVTEVETAYGWGRLTRMAIHTAVGFIALSTGMVSLLWRRDLTRDALLPRWFPVPMCVGVVTATVCFWQALETEFAQINEGSLVTRSGSQTPEVLLVVGTMLGLALALAAYLAQTSLRRAQEADSANRVLADEIAERRQAEEALLQEKRRLEEVTSTANCGLLLLNPQCEVLYANKLAQEWFGTLDQIEGRQCRDIFGLKNPDTEGASLQVVRTGETARSEVFTQVLGGATRAFYSVASPVKDSRGRIRQITEVVVDVTEHRRAEQALARLNHDLEVKNREMEQFVHTVSHDLKSPLVTIQGFAGHLKQDVSEGRMDRLSGCSDRIQNAIERMTQLINELLDLSRIGRVAGKPKPIRLAEMIQRICRTHEEQLAERGIVVNAKEAMPTIRGDEERIVQVFDNLINNAIKYGCSAGEPRIDIGTEVLGERVRVFIRDNGRGIPPEYHDKIFGLFQRLDADEKGTGVGLAIARRIMEVHGGRIWVESDLGAGATFWAEFPAGRGTPERAAASAPEEA